jgi:hypothetical protein
MKPSIYINQQSSCGKERYSRSSHSLFFQSSLTVVVSSLSNLGQKIRLPLRLVSANKAILVGLLALVNSATVNKSRFAGLACLGILAPLSKVFYLVFDESARDWSWYHINHYYLFNALGTDSFQIFFYLLGVFLILPSNLKPEYWFAPFLGYPIIKAALIIQCTSNEQWHESIPIELLISMGMLGLCLGLGLRFFSWVKFHKHDGIVARMDGLFRTPFKAEDKELLLKKTWEDYKQFHKVY